MRKKYWTTSTGEEIAFDKLEDIHLLNILKWIEKKATDGFVVSFGSVFFPEEEMWLDEDHYQGQNALDYFGYKTLCKEALKRGLITEKEYLLKV